MHNSNGPTFYRESLRKNPVNFSSLRRESE